jgi:hypothetical protein
VASLFGNGQQIASLAPTKQSWRWFRRTGDAADDAKDLSQWLQGTMMIPPINVVHFCR